MLIFELVLGEIHPAFKIEQLEIAHLTSSRFLNKSLQSVIPLVAKFAGNISLLYNRYYGSVIGESTSLNDLAQFTS